MAADAFVTAVVGGGWTPGISNLLATHAVEALGEAPRVDVDWVGSVAESEGLAVINHVIHVLDGDVVQSLDGQRRMVPAGSMGPTVGFPDLGRVSTAACGHSEPITLPEHLPVETVPLRGALLPAYQNTLVAAFDRLGLTATESRADTVARGIHVVEGLLSVGGVYRSAVRVAATDGDRDRTYAAVGPMGALTGSPAAVGALSVLDEDHPDGVHPPEATVDPGPFLDRLVDGPVEFYRVPGNEPVTSFEGYSPGTRRPERAVDRGRRDGPALSVNGRPERLEHGVGTRRAVGRDAITPAALLRGSTAPALPEYRPHSRVRRRGFRGRQPVLEGGVDPGRVGTDRVDLLSPAPNAR